MCTMLESHACTGGGKFARNAGSKMKGNPFDQPTLMGTGGRHVAGMKVFSGRFLLDRCLNKDFAGEVWLVNDVDLGGVRELKFLPEEVAADAASVAQLKREAVVGRRLTHPRIVRVDEFHAENGLVAVSREHVDGQSLADILEADARQHLDVAEITGWISDICEALEYAHGEAKAVHRDLRLEQVLVCKTSSRAKVTDFGLSRRVLETQTRLTGRQSREELPYSSPQSVMGERGTAADDLYALGVLIYHLLTGRPPFWRGDVSAQVLDDVPPSMAVRRGEFVEGGVYQATGREIPAAWERAVAACLEKTVEKRPTNVQTFRAMLAGAVAGGPGMGGGGVAVRPVPMSVPGRSPGVNDVPVPPLPPPVNSIFRKDWDAGGPIAVGPVAGRPVAPPVRDTATLPVTRTRESKKVLALVATVIGLAGVIWLTLTAINSSAARKRAELETRRVTQREEQAEKIRIENQQKDAAAAAAAKKKAEQEAVAAVVAAAEEAKKQAAQEAATAVAEEAKKKADATAATSTKSIRETQARQLVSDYLKACDAGDSGTLRRIFSNDVNYLGSIGSAAALTELSNYAKEKPQRVSLLSSSDMVLSSNGNRASISGWMDFEHGDGIMSFKGRVNDEYVIEWDSSNTPRLASVRRIESGPSTVSFDQAKQKQAVEQCLWGYFNAADWSGGNPRIPDQGLFLADAVFYFDKRMTRDEVRADGEQYRRGLRSVVFNDKKANLNGLGTEMIDVEMTGMARKVDMQGQERTFPVKNHLVIAFRKANNYKPWIEEIRNIK